MMKILMMKSKKIKILKKLRINFTKIIKSISKGEIPEIMGNIYSSKDYIHASDISRAIIGLVENQADGVFNLASGDSTSTKILLNMIYQKFGKELSIKEKVNDTPKMIKRVNKWVEPNNINSLDTMHLI